MMYENSMLLGQSYSDYIRGDFNWAEEDKKESTMITIRRDTDLVHAAEITNTDWQVLVNEIIRILRPAEDAYVGYNLEDFVADIDYSIEKLLQDINIKPTSEVVKAIGKLKLFYMDADNPCPKCGYELAIGEETTTDEDMGIPFYECTCPICHMTTSIHPQ